MTREEREEAIKGLEGLSRAFGGYKPNEEMFEMAIAALKAEPCEDAVSRADILQKYDKYCEDNCPYSKKQRNVMCGACMMGDAIEIVESLPPVTPKQRTGKWIENTVVIDEFTNEEDTFYVCGCCNERICQPHKYCPNCGAKMEGESE